jgi:hypothetical protein
LRYSHSKELAFGRMHLSPKCLKESLLEIAGEPRHSLQLLLGYGHAALFARSKVRICGRMAINSEAS